MKRRPFSGTIEIIQFNWPFYLIGLVALSILFGVLWLVALTAWFAGLLWLGFAAAAWWFVASLVVSYWVYDAAVVTDGAWMNAFLGRPGRWAELHAGLDQATPGLAALWGEPSSVLDIFDEAEMTEPSIHRARRLAVNAYAATPAAYGALPLPDESLDAVCLVFAAHELRSRRSREKLFAELYRVLAPGGKVLIVEHLRDFANFVAFGPGFLHFLPDSEWRGVPTSAGFRLAGRTQKTPFVAAYRWEKP